MEPGEHWQRVWTTKDVGEVSWFESNPETCVELIRAVALPGESHVVDVGGGASSLVDQLLARGFTRVTVVDISEVSLQLARARLGASAAGVAWLVADARTLRLSEPADVWHDRAVFHFLTDVADQDAYLTALRGAVRVGGHVVMATFGRGGPEKCSGLPVQRYDPTALAERLGRDFRTLRLVEKEHLTPQGSRQQFTYGLFRRIS